MIDFRGKVLKVVKVASDITQTKLRNAEFETKLNAISLVQAVIEFTPAGKVITANELFLSVSATNSRRSKASTIVVRRAPPISGPGTTRRSGRSSIEANTLPTLSSVSGKTGRRYGYRRPTIRSSTSTERS